MLGLGTFLKEDENGLERTVHTDMELEGIVADSAYTSVQTRDSIAIVQSWERSRKLWFIKYGRKRHIQTVTNANPNAKITYSVFVEKIAS